MDQHPEIVWELAFAELKRAAGGESAQSQSDDDTEIDDNVGDVAEKKQENSWKCPNAQRRRSLVALWAQPPKSAAEARLRQVRLAHSDLGLWAH